MADWLARAATAIPEMRESPTAYTVRGWRIHYPNGAAMDVLFTPAATRADVAEVYPGASVEPMRDTATRPPTAAEADELRALVNIVLVDDSDTERAEALAMALADPEAALEGLRALTAHRRPIQ